MIVSWYAGFLDNELGKNSLILYYTSNDWMTVNNKMEAIGREMIMALCANCLEIRDP
jgi:hypothetical protein